MESEKKERPIKIHSTTSFGGLWFAGWLFTIAFAKLTGWSILFSLVIWPYYLGKVLK